MPDEINALRSALADRYAIVREIGSGGMAIVYLAQDLKHHRKVALKALRPAVACALGAERFFREIEIAAQLTHPHIVPLYDSGQANGLLYYVMPYVEGESLRERLKRDKHVPLREALDIASGVASALSYAHGQGIIHRDIKPENILLSSGEAVVTDFGIARAISAAGGDSISHADIPVGTLGYMSPEQALGSRELDGRADVYSLGCVMHEMLTGGLPGMWTDEDLAAMRKANGRPSGRLRLDGTVPAAIREAVGNALALAPTDRIQTADELARTITTRRVPGASPAEWLGPLGSTGVYAAFAVVVAAVLRFLEVQLGLPDWAFLAAGLLLIAGIPMIAATAVVERQVTHGKWRRWRWLTWRRVVRSGVLALSVWGGVVGVYMGMRILGIGPVGTLVAAGILEEREAVVLADFENRTDDPMLAAAVTEAFRVDLAQSSVVSLVDPAHVRRVLGRMQRDSTGSLDPQSAREVALRSGAKAIIVGEITAAGTGFLLSARVLSAETGEVLVAHRESASDSSKVIDAIDRLSARLRARIGESLTTLRANEPLEQVTTSSLSALRKYSLGERAIRDGDLAAGRRLLQEAVALDSTFSMAYRKLGLITTGRAEQVRVLTEAFEHRDRSTDRERYLTLGTYYSEVTYEHDKAIAAYRTLLDAYPSDSRALNNLGYLYSYRRDPARAAEFFRRAAEVDSLSAIPHVNLAICQYELGEVDEARATLERLEHMVPGHPRLVMLQASIDGADGDYDRARTRLEAFLGEGGPDLFWSVSAHRQLADLAILQGRFAAAVQHLRAANADGEALGQAAVSLQSELALALVDVWFREDTAAGLARVRTALASHVLDDVDPLDRPYLLLALIYAVAGEPDGARAVLREFEEAVDPAVRRGVEPQRHEILGFIALTEGRNEDAIEEFRRADVGPCAICQLPNLGMAYDRAGNADSTIAVYERYVEMRSLSRTSTDAFMLGWTLERLGQLYSARSERRKAADYFARLVRLWEDGDADVQRHVDAARQALRDLTSEPAVPIGAGRGVAPR